MPDGRIERDWAFDRVRRVALRYDDVFLYSTTGMQIVADLLREVRAEGEVAHWVRLDDLGDDGGVILAVVELAVGGLEP